MTERKLVGTNEMFKKALAGGYAIGAYNVNNMEILQAIAEAAEETKNNAYLLTNLATLLVKGVCFHVRYVLLSVSADSTQYRL